MELRFVPFFASLSKGSRDPRPVDKGFDRLSPNGQMAEP